MSARYVVAGVAPPRTPWFPLVSQWANSGAIPIEFVKCIGLGELEARLESARTFSAVLIDAGIPGVDRDLLARARERGVAAIVVADAKSATDWRSLGADAVLDREFDRAALLDALASRAVILRHVEPVTPMPGDLEESSPIRAKVVAVVGSGGTGASTVAIAVAEAFGRHAAFAGSTVLADFCLASEQAMLHDTRRVAPGLQELVDHHRTSTPSGEDVRELCFEITGRNYELLVGIRRRRLWNTIRPVACARALDSLATSYAAVVIDTDDDVEGEAESGSVDLEERNVLARTALRAADEIVAVGSASLKGLHSLTRVIADLRAYDIDDERIHPVINLAPSSPRGRAGYTAALADLCATEDHTMPPPIFVPFRNVDECIRAVSPLPLGVVEPFMSFVHGLLPTPTHQGGRRGWSRIVPGSLARAQAIS